MNVNVGAADHAIRTVVGLGLLGLIFLRQGATRWLGLIGLIPLLTALVRFCPLYKLLCISSFPASKRG